MRHVAAIVCLWILPVGAGAQIEVGPGGNPSVIDGDPFGGSGGIVGSAHDFSGSAWADGEICKPCHTPHFAMPDTDRLWNHELTEANYEMHSGAGSADLDFDLASRLCLSCHDGTVALDSFGGSSGTTFISPESNLGTDLTDDHPIGSDAEYPPEDKPSWWDTAMRDPSTFPGSVRLKDWVSKHTGNTIKVVSCTTCHNVHNRYNHEYMLTLDNSGSELCLACHIK